jgi:hypothetical protein
VVKCGYHIKLLATAENLTTQHGIESDPEGTPGP